MSKHARDVAVGVLKYGIGFGLLAWIITSNWNDKVDPPSPGLGTLLSRPIAYDALAWAAVLMAVTVSLQLVRWFLLVRALDLVFTLRNAFRLGLIGYFYNTVLPGSVGGDLLKGYFIAKDQPARKAAAVATVIADRAMGLFGLILFVAVSGSVAWAMGDERLRTKPALQDMVVVTAGIAGASAAGFLLLGLLPARRADRFAGRLRGLGKVGPTLAEVWYAVWAYRQRLGTVVLGVAVTAVAHLAMVSSFYFASRAFTADDPAAIPTFQEIMVVAPIGFIVQALPLSPGGVGVGEAAFAKLYELCGRDGANGLAARLALRLVEWGLGACGYVVYLRMKKELPTGEPGTMAELVGTEPAKVG